MIQEKDKYVVASVTILESNQATNTSTGEVIQITPEMKCVYFYMREKYCMSIKYNNKYTESWESIVATVAPMSGQKLKKLSKALRDIGLVITLSKKDSSKQVVDVCDVEGWVFSNDKQHRKTVIDYLYVINFKKDGCIKVGRSFDVEKRTRQLLRVSNHKQDEIDILAVYTGTHQEVYDTEQRIHEELARGGYYHNDSDWSVETFDPDCENVLFHLLDKSGLSKGAW
ncbi:TPA: GIY-YIG nuclease family protein [Vibrio cholerae]|nr:GIY-YIG nuclease family protein [Vibrio cholerae]